MNNPSKKELFIWFVCSYRIIPILIISAIASLTMTSSFGLHGLFFYLLTILMASGFSYFFVHFLYVRAKKDIKEKFDGLNRELGKVDYWYWNKGSAIAVDIASQRIAVNRQHTFSPYVFDFKDIDEISTPIYEPLHMHSRDTSQFYATGVENARRDSMAAERTGLSIKLNSLEVPTVFVVMGEQDMEYWLRLFKKMQTGEAKVTASPMTLPSSQF
ncbi:hypothetical protein OCT63_17040 [Vibrio sp. RW]|uniref:hypothetical protein n=1 Tax=Vibrio sp. RW TaxID=2998833 RepID=UPI0022CD7BA1|nr:hypothetical protein [Vibrio sp. RW]MDA0145933.1 hypothetical protein [Vibrio sp. RW]